MDNICNEHSGCIKDIANIKEDIISHEEIIRRIDGKLNMIIGAIAMAPFIWTLLSGIVRIAQASIGG